MIINIKLESEKTYQKFICDMTMDGLMRHVNQFDFLMVKSIDEDRTYLINNSNIQNLYVSEKENTTKKEIDRKTNDDFILKWSLSQFIEFFNEREDEHRLTISFVHEYLGDKATVDFYNKFRLPESIKWNAIPSYFPTLHSLQKLFSNADFIALTMAYFDLDQLEFNEK